MNVYLLIYLCEHWVLWLKIKSLIQKKDLYFRKYKKWQCVISGGRGSSALEMHEAGGNLVCAGHSPPGTLSS